MQVQKTTNQNFGARFISPANIKYKSPNGRWEKIGVSFIKFEPNKKEDVKILNEIRDIWAGKNLSSAIVDEAEILRGKAHIYGLTSQDKNFENINPRQILGLMTTDKIKKNENIEVFKIGTNPLFAYEQNHKDRTFKHIAKSMVETLKSFVGSNSKNSEVFSRYAESESEAKFLKRIGLEPREKNFM